MQHSQDFFQKSNHFTITKVTNQKNKLSIYNKSFLNSFKMSNHPNTEYTTGATQETGNYKSYNRFFWTLQFLKFWYLFFKIAGNVVGSENLKAKGQARKAEGNRESDIGTNDTNKGPSKTTGQLHATKGAVKETIGSALKNTSLEHSGAQERQTGNREIDAAKTKDATKGAYDNVKGTVKENAGYVAGDPQWEAEGKGDRVKGQAQYNANQ